MNVKFSEQMDIPVKRGRSLSVRLFRMTMIQMLLLGSVCLFIGLGMYFLGLLQLYTKTASDIARNISEVLENRVDAGAYGRKVMGIYRSLNESERAETGTSAYYTRFQDLEQEADYRRLVQTLRDMRCVDDVKYVYFAGSDEETVALVYIADSDDESEDGYVRIGTWEESDPDEVRRFLGYDGTGPAPASFYTMEPYAAMLTCGYPIVKNDTSAGFIMVDIAIGTVLRGLKTIALRFTAVTLLLALLLGALFERKSRKTLVIPIDRLAAAAMEYARDKKNGIETAEHFTGLDIHTGDEVEHLADILSEMECDITEYVHDLSAMASEKERIGAELTLAKRIQTDMLPSLFPKFTGSEWFSINAMMEPAKEVGGDFYDFFYVDSDRLALVVADVSGKGIPAALFSMIAKTMLNTQAQTGLSPKRVLEEVNASLSEKNKEDMFVTVWLGVLELSTGWLTYADAGHERLLIRQNGEWRFLPKTGGLALAVCSPEETAFVDDRYRFRDQAVQLRPGDAILQYTDGVTEAENAAHELFGEDRLLAAVNGAPSAEPEDLLPWIRAQLDKFAEEVPQFDDITMLGLRYRAAAGGS